MVSFSTYLPMKLPKLTWDKFNSLPLFRNFPLFCVVNMT